MLTTTAFLLLQFIISAKAGLVNAVEGTSNVHVQQQLQVGSPVTTGPTGRVEILLNPASFLRLGENSEAVFDSVDLTNIAVRILSGSAIIESGSVDKDSPIRVTSSALSVSIVSPGVYRFAQNAASVLDGELQAADADHSVIRKGSEIKAMTDDQGSTSYQQAKLDADTQSTPLDDWNRQRSQQIAAVNSRTAQTDSASNNPDPFYQGPFVYPGAVPSYGFGPRIMPSYSPFSFFQWYGGGYSFFQPFAPTAPLLISPPFYIGGRPRPILRPTPVGPRPPAVTPFHPAPRPVPSRPSGGFSRGRR